MGTEIKRYGGAGEKKMGSMCWEEAERRWATFQTRSDSLTGLCEGVSELTGTERRGLGKGGVFRIAVSRVKYSFMRR